MYQAFTFYGNENILTISLCRITTKSLNIYIKLAAIYMIFLKKKTLEKLVNDIII